MRRRSVLFATIVTIGLFAGLWWVGAPRPAGSGAATPATLDAPADPAAPADDPVAVAPAAPLAARPVAAVSGTVRDPRGAPVAGATVAVALAVAAGPGQGDLLHTATTTAGGVFHVAGMTPGSVIVVQAWAPGFAPGPLVEAAAGETGLDVVVLDALAIHGTVIDSDEVPIAGATLSVRPALTGGAAILRRLAPPVSVRSGEDGTFVLDGLDGGPHDLVAEAPGFAKLVRPGVLAPVDGVYMRLTAAGGLVGVVRDAQGAAVTSFTVAWSRQVILGRRGETLDFDAADGAFRVTGVPATELVVTIAAPGHGPVERNVRVTAGTDLDVSVTLPAPARLAGRVVTLGGAPIVGARVSLAAGPDGEAFTDDDGRFELDDVAPGRRSLVVEASGHVSRREAGLELGPGDDRRVDVVLTPLEPYEELDGVVPVEVSGIGAVVEPLNEGMVVIDVMRGGPADRAGLVRGDLVTGVDCEPIAGRPFAEIAEQVRGVAGTFVRIIVRRDAGEQKLDMVRGTVRADGRPSQTL